MALPDRKTNPLCHLLRVAGEWYLVPLNSEGSDACDAAFAAEGALTTVAVTQESAGRGGYAQTEGGYQALKLALS
jgi:hypothetical protein